MSWLSQPIHVMDFEGSSQYGVIEYGVATLQDGKIQRCHTRLCEAEDAIDERDAWLHGLRRADTDGHPRFAENFTYFNELRQNGPLCAHHASVEHRLLKRSWPYPTAAPDYSSSGQTVADWGPWLDTRALYQKLYPDLSEHKLGALIQRFGLQSELDTLSSSFCPPTRSRYHCALYDALAAALLLQQLAKIPEWAALSLPELFSISTGTPSNTQTELF